MLLLLVSEGDMSERKGTRREQGSGSIYQRKADGRWVSVVNLGWSQGKRQRKYYVSRTEAEAVAKLNKALGEHGRGSLMAADRTTVAQFLTSWLEDTARHNLRESSYRSYADTIMSYLIPAIGTRRLDQLTPQHVQGMVNALSRSGLSPRTVHKVRAVLRGALNNAMQWGMVYRNVATLVRMPAVKQYEGNVLSPQEARQLIHWLDGHRLEALITLTLALGLRQGEVLGLRWQDVDIERHELRIRQQYNARTPIPALSDSDTAPLAQMTPAQRSRFYQDRYGPRFGEPKTERSRRPLPIPTPLVQMLKRHKAGQNEDRLLAGERWAGLDLIFTTSTGTPIDPSRLNRQYRAAFDAAGLERREFHDLRRSCASLLAAWQVPAPIVRDILGHSNIATTLNIYTRTYSDDIRDALDRMGGLMEEPEKDAK
jgi:integrase